MYCQARNTFSPINYFLKGVQSKRFHKTSQRELTMVKICE